MTTSGYVLPLIVQELLEERFGPRPAILLEHHRYIILTPEQRQHRRVLLGLEDENGTQ